MTTWDEGFDAGMAERPFWHVEIGSDEARGFAASFDYRRAIRNRPAEPRDTKISYIEEFLECQPK